MVVTEKFEISDVRWLFRRSSRIGTDVQDRVRERIESALVHCKGCGSTWRATETSRDQGRIQSGATGVLVECTRCKVSELIPAAKLDE